jgi:hypothetical protein
VPSVRGLIVLRIPADFFFCSHDFSLRIPAMKILIFLDSSSILGSGILLYVVRHYSHQFDGGFA